MKDDDAVADLIGAILFAFGFVIVCITKYIIKFYKWLLPKLIIEKYFTLDIIISLVETICLLIYLFINNILTNNFFQNILRIILTIVFFFIVLIINAIFTKVISIIIERKTYRNKFFKGTIAVMSALMFAIIIDYSAQIIKWKKVGDGLKTLNLENGTYDGHVLSREFSGSGKYVLNTGSSYNGEWFNSKLNGQGTLKIDSLGTYTGEFSNGVRKGEGKFTWDNGDYVIGNWENDELVGDFTLVKDNWQFSCSAEEDNYLLKKLTYVDEDYSIYWDLLDISLSELDFASCRETCKANYENNDGTKIVGYLIEDNFNGECKVEFSNGDSYEGELVNGIRSGYGTYKWSSNAKYCGNWSNDMMNGEGTYYYNGTSDNYLKGEFLDNYPIGECTCRRCIYSESIDGTWKTIWSDGECVSVKKVSE